LRRSLICNARRPAWFRPR